MKKIMIAAVAIMLGIAANAAAVTWGVTAVTGPDASAAPAGWVAYVLDGADYAAFSALDGDKVAAFAADNAIATGAVVAGRGGSVVSIKGGNFANSSAVSSFMVIFDNASAADADNFAYTAVGNTSINDSGADSSIGFGTFASATATTGGWQSTDVPEPTSGLLLLLGVAGLALKRKRA
ncbi:MAG: PEP-CTERM sorting domain-containing protein [Kiritimatiellae bacterium]|nr:PEP-CTERM sorting domain-containing protein [Kiritimatiellia bacterium]